MIKRAVQLGYGLSNNQVRGKAKDRPAEQLAGAAPRDMLEAVGLSTHLAAPGTTARDLHKRLTQHASQGRSIAVDGVRDPTEEAVIRAMGGTMWRVDNGKPPNARFPVDKRQTSVGHDATIDSGSGSKSEIRANVDKAMMALIRGSGLAKPTTKSE